MPYAVNGWLLVCEGSFFLRFIFSPTHTSSRVLSLTHRNIICLTLLEQLSHVCGGAGIGAYTVVNYFFLLLVQVQAVDALCARCWSEGGSSLVYPSLPPTAGRFGEESRGRGWLPEQGSAETPIG